MLNFSVYSFVTEPFSWRFEREIAIVYGTILNFRRFSAIRTRFIASRWHISHEVYINLFFVYIWGRSGFYLVTSTQFEKMSILWLFCNRMLDRQLLNHWIISKLEIYSEISMLYIIFLCVFVLSIIRICWMLFRYCSFEARIFCCWIVNYACMRMFVLCLVVFSRNFPRRNFAYSIKRIHCAENLWYLSYPQQANATY